MAFHPYRPIDPRSFPFYYGWVILFASTIGMLAAVPGSPPGMSPFLEPMLEAYGVRRGDITFAYMIGTIAAGVATWKFGSLFDSVDSRVLGTFMTAFAHLFFRHSPDRVGIALETTSSRNVSSGENTLADHKGEAHFPVYRDFSPSEAIRTFTFWIFIAGIAFNGLIGTGIVINLVAFGTDQGLSESQALALLLPSAVFNILTTLILGMTAHRIL